jgi:hypothetical protein
MTIHTLSEENYYKHLKRPHHPPDDAMPEADFEAEYDALYDRVEANMSEHGENSAYSDGDYNLEPCIAKSRGLGFEITNPSIVTESLLRRLQALIIQHAPLWEIYMGSCHYDFGIFIGPEKIQMNRHPGLLRQLDEWVVDAG